MSGLRGLALAGVVATASMTQARAADWLQSVIEPQEAEPVIKPIELGTGWYLRGDVAGGTITNPILSAVNARGSDTTYSGDLGFGYKFNDWLRLDLTLEGRRQQTAAASTLSLNNGSPIICPAGLEPLTTPVAIGALPAGSPIGYLFDTTAGTCSQTTKTSIDSQTLLLNGYIDLGTWSGFTPYVGAGVGVSRLESTTAVNYYNTANNADYAPSASGNPAWSQTNGTPVLFVDRYGTQVFPVIPNTNIPVSVLTPPQWNQRINAVHYNFAWALMGGVAYALTDRAKLDVGFRYLNIGAPSTGGGDIVAKEVRVGLRYLID